MKKLAFWVLAAALAACAFGAWEAARLPCVQEDAISAENAAVVAQVGKVAAIIGDEVWVKCIRPTWGVESVVTTNANETTVYAVQWISGAGTTNAVTNAMSYADLRNAQAAYAGWAADTNLTVSLATNVEVEVWAVVTNLVPVVESTTTNGLSVGDFVLPGDWLAETTDNDNAIVILEH